MVTAMSSTTTSATNYSWYFRKDGIIPTQVNLIGQVWSRGGITCHMLANAMLKILLKDIPVNIFAIDPVPGPLNFQPKR